MKFHLSQENIKRLENTLCELAQIEEKNGLDSDPMDEFEAIMDHLEQDISEFEGV